MGNEQGKREVNLTSQSSKKSKRLGNLDDLIIYSANRDLPIYSRSYNWDVYLDKKPIWGIFNGVPPHERLIIKLKDDVLNNFKALAVEIGVEPNHGNRFNSYKTEDWVVNVSLISLTNDDEGSNNESQNNWEKQGTANFSLETLKFYIEQVTSKFGDYNVLTNNCQTFARKIIKEIGNIKMNKINDGTKGIISASILSFVSVTAVACLFGNEKKNNNYYFSETNDDD